MDRIIQINQADNVAVALSPISKGTALNTDNNTCLTSLQDIPQGHKLALADISQGDPVIKYGYPIGYAIKPVKAGEWIHTHNVETGLSEESSYSYRPDINWPDPLEPLTFNGYVRADGRAGTRNEIWIIPTVGCVNHICTRLAAYTHPSAVSRGIDGAYAFTHPYGCSQMGDDHEMTKKILADLARHPNAGGILFVGLGCENNTMTEFQKELGSWDPDRVKFMVAQNEVDELDTGRQLLKQLIESASKDKRRTVSADKLIVGLKCGASDGLSGITANAAVGLFSDLLISMGGTTILTEVPEMFGAEEILMNRCITPEVYQKTVKMVTGFKDYFVRYGQVVYENPSPGNKDGGITTLEDKSLGCVQKGGTAPVTDVLAYGDIVKKAGLNLLSGPGNDIVSTTALTAAGAQIILFTTGRGTPFGAPAVTLKIASNSDLAKHKPNWIDFDAGVIADGRKISDTASDLLKYVCKVASGDILSKAEENGYREIAIFKDGVTL